MRSKCDGLKFMEMGQVVTSSIDGRFDPFRSLNRSLIEIDSIMEINREKAFEWRREQEHNENTSITLESKKDWRFELNNENNVEYLEHSFISFFFINYLTI